MYREKFLSVNTELPYSPFRHKHSGIFYRCLAFLFLTLFAVPAIADSASGRIIGRIVDAATGQPLPGANVSVEGTLLGAGSDEDGLYIIDNVPAGSWKIRVDYIGYSARKATISVKADQQVTADFSLKASAVLFDQVVITGSRRAENLSEAANSVDVLPASEITKRNYLRMTDALQQLPSVDLLSETISVRGGTSYSLLDLGGSRVLMLIDDVPMLTSDMGRANWDFLPVTELERAEVLKGAASVLYGSGGASAVVNLISRKPTVKPHFAFRASYGVYDDPSVAQWKWTDKTLYFYRTDASYSQTIGPVGLRFSLSRHFTTGYRESNKLSRTYFTTRPIINFGDGSKLSLFFAYNRDERELFFFWKDQNHALENQFTGLDVAVNGYLFSAVYNKPFSPTFLTTARFSLNSQLLGLPFNLTDQFKPALGFSGELRASWLPTQKHDVSLGVDYRRDVTEATVYGKRTADGFSPYLQDTWKLTRALQMNAGLRYDVYMLSLKGGESTTENQLSPKFGLSYELFNNTTLHTSIGRGFRVPTIMERFTEYHQDFTLLKNPDLQPERSTLFDIGVRQRFGDKISAEISGFVSHYEQLIEMVELTGVSEFGLIFQFRNCPSAQIRGLESQVKVQLFDNRLNLLWNGTYMHAESRGDDPVCRLSKGDPLPYRPKYSLYFSPSYTLGPLTLETEYRYISRFDNVFIFKNFERVAQETLNLNARLHWKQFMLMFQVKNATNHNHAVIAQNIAEIRNFSVSFSGEF